MPGLPKPAPVQTTQFRLSLTADPVAPHFDSASGSYHVEAAATLYTGGGAGVLANQQVVFSAANGTVQNPTQWTNGQGVAKASFRGQKNNQPLKINATFSGVTATCEAKIDTLGAGNVSKMARLQPETVINLWSYYLPI